MVRHIGEPESAVEAILGISRIPMAVLPEREGVASSQESGLEVAQHGFHPAIRCNLGTALVPRGVL